METGDFRTFQPSVMSLCLPSQYLQPATTNGTGPVTTAITGDYPARINSPPMETMTGSTSAAMFRPYHQPPPPAAASAAAVDLMMGDKHSQFLQQLKKNALKSESDVDRFQLAKHAAALHHPHAAAAAVAAAAAAAASFSPSWFLNASHHHQQQLNHHHHHHHHTSAKRNRRMSESASGKIPPQKKTNKSAIINVVAKL